MQFARIIQTVRTIQPIRSIQTKLVQSKIFRSIISFRSFQSIRQIQSKSLRINRHFVPILIVTPVIPISYCVSHCISYCDRGINESKLVPINQLKPITEKEMRTHFDVELVKRIVSSNIRVDKIKAYYCYFQNVTVSKKSEFYNCVANVIASRTNGFTMQYCQVSEVHAQNNSTFLNSSFDNVICSNGGCNVMTCLIDSMKCKTYAKISRSTIKNVSCSEGGARIIDSSIIETLKCQNDVYVEDSRIGSCITKFGDVKLESSNVTRVESRDDIIANNCSVDSLKTTIGGVTLTHCKPNENAELSIFANNDIKMKDCDAQMVTSHNGSVEWKNYLIETNLPNAFTLLRPIIRSNEHVELENIHPSEVKCSGNCELSNGSIDQLTIIIPRIYLQQTYTITLTDSEIKNIKVVYDNSKEGCKNKNGSVISNIYMNNGNDYIFRTRSVNGKFTESVKQVFPTYTPEGIPLINVKVIGCPNSKYPVPIYEGCVSAENHM